jgi:hypothetical protein
LCISEKMFLDVPLLHTFMPDLIHQPWMVSIINNYLDKIRGERVKKMSVFVRAQGIKSVHVVVECLLIGLQVPLFSL